MQRNHVEQVVTTGCNSEDKGYETTDIHTCSRSRKSLLQLAEKCVSLPYRNRHRYLSQEQKEKFINLTMS